MSLQLNVQGPVLGNASLSEMPEEIIHECLSFNPDAALILRVVSRKLRGEIDGFLQLNRERITSRFGTPSALYTLVSRTFAQMGLRFGPLSRSCDIQFHLSLPHAVWTLGVRVEECPERILMSEELDLFDRAVPNAQETNLQRIWPRIHPLIPPPAAVPGIAASAQDIHTWMHANQPLLQGILELRLNDLHLTGAPSELGLCTGLQGLYLHNNQLRSLPEGLFQGLDHLQILHLNDNQLRSLPEGLFQGLVQLQELSLQYNYLETLPGGLFQGPIHLQRLYLNNNRLRSLPERIFQGLERLEMLHLYNNRLRSLPEGLLQGLGNLQMLFLSNTQLRSLPERLFEGAQRLQTLTLHGNPGLMVSYTDLPSFANNLFLRDILRDFFRYECRTPFARLYQLAAGGAAPKEAVRELFSGLPTDLQNYIYWMVWVEAGKPNTGDPQWGEHHTLDDMQIFNGALKRVVKEMFHKLTPEQKQAVYLNVYHLAHPEREAPPNWGSVHAFDNIPRLIDAMCQ